MANTKSEESKLRIEVASGCTQEAALARAVLRPTFLGAITVQQYANWVPADLDLHELMHALSEQTTAVIDDDMGRAEAMLTVQAHTLDAIFNNLARRAMNAELLSQFEAYLKLSLRAQSQCRCTWDAISSIKHPPTAAFVRQTNIAHGHQQVNNSPPADEIQNPPNKLMKGKKNESQEWMDCRTPKTAERTDSHLETVAEIDRAEDASREVESVPERLQGRNTASVESACPGAASPEGLRR